MSYQGTTAEWTKKADNDQCVRIRLDKTRCGKCYRSAAIRTKVFWTNFALIFLGLEYKLSKFITSLYPLQLAGTWSMLSSWFDRRATVSLLLLFESLVGSSRSVIGGGWIVSLWSSLVTWGWMVVPNFSLCLLRWRCKIFLNVRMATFPGGGLVISCPWLLPINTFCNGRGMRCRLGPFILIGDCSVCHWHGNENKTIISLVIVVLSFEMTAYQPSKMNFHMSICYSHFGHVSQVRDPTNSSIVIQERSGPVSIHISRSSVISHRKPQWKKCLLRHVSIIDNTNTNKLRCILECTWRGTVCANQRIILLYNKVTPTAHRGMVPPLLE